MIVCNTFNSSKCENFLWSCDFKNKERVKLITCNERPCHYAFWVYIWNLYLNWLLINRHLSIPWLLWKNSTLGHKIRTWRHCNLILDTPSSVHIRCPQVWYGTPGPNGRKTICLFRWKPIDFHWKCLWLLWP